MVRWKETFFGNILYNYVQVVLKKRKKKESLSESQRRSQEARIGQEKELKYVNRKHLRHPEKIAAKYSELEEVQKNSCGCADIWPGHLAIRKRNTNKKRERWEAREEGKREREREREREFVWLLLSQHNIIHIEYMREGMNGWERERERERERVGEGGEGGGGA